MKDIREATDNELIAEFMGFYITSERDLVDGTKERTWKSNDNPYFGGFRTPHLEKFETSWDFLMPVVEKIKTLKYRVEIHLHYIQSRCEIYGIAFDTKAVGGFQVEKDAPLIEHVYKAVLEFIKWYNTEVLTKK